MQFCIETPRLILRHWQESDIEPLAMLNADKKVMEFFLKPLNKDESYQLYIKAKDELLSYGYGVYAVELKEDRKFIGFVGFHQIPFDMDFTPGIEILWRLVAEKWNQGYATEAASACLEYAKKQFNFKEIYAFTSILNKRSERVMQKIGMQKVKDFNHPLVQPDNPLYRHVLYKIDMNS